MSSSGTGHVLQAMVSAGVVAVHLVHRWRQQVAVVCGAQHGAGQAEGQQVTPVSQRRQLKTLQCLLVGGVVSAYDDAHAALLDPLELRMLLLRESRVPYWRSVL